MSANFDHAPSTTPTGDSETATDTAPLAPKSATAGTTAPAPTINTNAPVLPLHALPGLRAKRAPGRPARPRLAPDADEVAYRTAIADAEQHHVESDVVVLSATLRDGSAELLDRIIVKVAAESAAIGYEISRLGDQRAKERARSRRIRSLEILARLIVDRRRAQLDGNECSPGKMAMVTELFIRDVGAIAAEVLGNETATELMRVYREKLVAEGFVASA